jgi:hypothetical protein
MPSLVPRDWFAALDRCTYLNQASLGLTPAAAVQSMHAFVNETAQFGNLSLPRRMPCTLRGPSCRWWDPPSPALFPATGRTRSPRRTTRRPRKLGGGTIPGRGPT